MSPLLPLLLLSACAESLEEVEVPMRDGVHLATDVYLPEGRRRRPAIVMRTPYGKATMAEIALMYRDQGLAVVVQDLRGRFDSEGVDEVFTTDGDGALQDGVDTLQWVVDQRWSDGRVVTWGASALGVVQHVQAAADPPGLSGMVVHFSTGDLYDNVYFPGGVFRESLVVGWLETQQNTQFFDDLDAHPYADAFWDPVQTSDDYGTLHVPAAHATGWYDIFRDGALDAFTGAQEQGDEGARGRQKLIIGPWSHFGVGRTQQGELTLPEQSTDAPDGIWPSADALLLETLQVDPGQALGDYDAIPPVQYYVMGDVDAPDAPGNEWRTAEAWPPPAAPIRFYLDTPHVLAERCPIGAQFTSWTHDPEHPVPTICGANLNIPSGSCDQRPIEVRPDVVVFETAPLAEPMELTGTVRAHLFVSIDQPDSDVVVRISDVYPDGRSMLITDGATRLATRGRRDGLTPLSPGEVVEAEVVVGTTSIVLDAGHRLRASFSGSSWPRYLVNRGTGLALPEMVEQPGVPVTVTLHHETAAASYLELPLVERSATEVLACP